MTAHFAWTRRHILKTSVAGAAAALTAGRATSSLAAPALVKGSKLTYWGGLIFSDKANKLLVDTINKWGADNGIQTEVVMINQNETVQKVSAAVASNTLPDALDLSLDLLMLLSRQGVFHTVDEIFDSLGKAQGGWFPAIASASDTSKVAGGRTGIPYGVSGNLLLRRNDLLSKAGFKNPPTTWEELSQQAAAINKPPLYGLGLALSNVGDGNVQVGVLQSYGGRIADDTGTKAAIKSEATREYLKWVKAAWDKKLFPPGNTTWDGAGDNNAYLAGQAAFIANTGSVGIAAKSQDPELYQATLYSSLPGGPKGVVSATNTNLRAIPKSSKNPDAARALLEFLGSPEFMNAYYEQAIYGPVLQGQSKLKAFTSGDPILSGLLDLVVKGTAPAYPDVYNTAFADAYNNFVVPKMVQRVVIDNWDFDRAMDEAQTVTQSIYDKYK
ncbi:extracellular solute-binding protein [uncultured Alsobacter sp.]|uniref:extracellular solute-binding protein n=1 Tax=uncultured Alsobacter sp. TaxID=1748258 RepID=UPI0025F273B5|nr:extracellular solute-binding protein [uncultured Alsobacter sp.]